MPKTAISTRAKAQKVMRSYPSEFTLTPSGELFCLHCSTTVSCEKNFLVDKHRETNKHVRKAERSTVQSSSTSQKQQFLHVGKCDFALDVTKAFLSADIPLWKLRHPAIRRLFTTFGNPLPSEETCRSRIPLLYDEEISRIRMLIEDKPIFLIIDESEVSGCKFMNILVGTLENPKETNMCVSSSGKAC